MKPKTKRINTIPVASPIDPRESFMPEDRKTAISELIRSLIQTHDREVPLRTVMDKIKDVDNEDQADLWHFPNPSDLRLSAGWFAANGFKLSAREEITTYRIVRHYVSLAD